MLDKFLEWQKSNGLKDSTITTYRMYLNPMNIFKELDEALKNVSAYEYLEYEKKIKRPK